MLYIGSIVCFCKQLFFWHSDLEPRFNFLTAVVALENLTANAHAHGYREITAYTNFILRNVQRNVQKCTSTTYRRTSVVMKIG